MRWMVAHVVVVSCLALCGCSKKNAAEAAGAGARPPTPSAPVPTASNSAAATVAAATDDEPTAVADPAQVPSPDDPERRAARDIHKGNYKQALDQLEAQ